MGLYCMVHLINRRQLDSEACDIKTLIPAGKRTRRFSHEQLAGLRKMVERRGQDEKNNDWPKTDKKDEKGKRISRDPEGEKVNVHTNPRGNRDVKGGSHSAKAARHPTMYFREKKIVDQGGPR